MANKQFGSLPQHVAVIMDGNRRWAKKHHLPVVAGHRKVVEKGVEELIDHAGHLGISYITFWCFSTENWQRPAVEIKGIMNLFRLALKKYAQRMVDKGARLKVIGDTDKFDEDIREGILKYIDKSKTNDKITVTFGLNYGGRDEIIRAIARMMENGPLKMEERYENRRKREKKSTETRGKNLEGRAISEEVFSTYLDTVGMPDPDLIIRTGGEQRLSGFLLWQAEYSELYFTETLMPDFGAEALDEALEEYGKRQRRRGR